MDEKFANGFGLNESYVEILRAQWIENPLSVAKEWRDFFEDKAPKKSPLFGEDEKPLSQTSNALMRPAEQVQEKDDIITQPLMGIHKKIAENMEESLAIPTATSIRNIPMKVLEENRLVINQFLQDDARPRCSFTHIIAYAIVMAIKKFPAMNNCYAVSESGPSKLVRRHVNLGLAIDLPGRDGARTLVVPNIKSAEALDFRAFFERYNELIELAHGGKLDAKHFMGTTVTLTNPGGIGTMLSRPRLMKGQGAIIATGSISYPAEYEAASPETLQGLGIGKVMSVSSTYDHRVIQGAESGLFLAYLHDLLIGENQFYEKIFSALKIPHLPFRLKKDEAIVVGQQASITQTERAMRVSQLIHAYRVRGYLLADVDPLHLIPREHPELELASYG
ncbi:MAG TPA: 2-oxo acid dehydrogenase subunit E2, partial [Myxococcota bacterium]|nr:2-oxo acid dehydrogenase subunit E2 [Myxococcota bacterium]